MAGSRLVIFPSQHLERVSGPVLCLLAVNNESEPVVKSNLSQLSKADISCFSVLGPTDIWNELGKLEDNVRSLT